MNFKWTDLTWRTNFLSWVWPEPWLSLPAATRHWGWWDMITDGRSLLSENNDTSELAEKLVVVWFSTNSTDPWKATFLLCSFVWWTSWPNNLNIWAVIQLSMWDMLGWLGRCWHEASRICMMFGQRDLLLLEGDRICQSGHFKKIIETMDVPNRMWYSFILPHQSTIEKLLGVSNVSEGLLHKFHVHWVDQRRSWGRLRRTSTASTFGECLNNSRSTIHKNCLMCREWTNANAEICLRIWVISNVRRLTAGSWRLGNISGLSR